MVRCLLFLGLLLVASTNLTPTSTRGKKWSGDRVVKQVSQYLTCIKYFIWDQQHRLETEQEFDLEDTLPSTVTWNKALALASNPMNEKISAQAVMIYGSY